MTRPHEHIPVDAPDLEAALEVLRAQGLRASAARRLVLEALYATDVPLTAEQIAGGGADGWLPRSDPASVYRNLETLERAGLVRHVHLGHGPGRYARADGPPREYLMCEECGMVRAIEPAAFERVRELVWRELGHEPRFSHFPLTGRCSRCAR
jgi:Fur family ferric uptake transcriptional regulator